MRYCIHCYGLMDTRTVYAHRECFSIYGGPGKRGYLNTGVLADYITRYRLYHIENIKKLRFAV